jgi:Calcineurin-like phosphoesterase
MVGMPLTVLHLSDIHFRTADNWVAHRVTQIAGAARTCAPTNKDFLVLTSGDVAFSGNPAEYASASRFFLDLKRELVGDGDGTVRFAFVPGNHDCDFTTETETRRLLLRMLNDLEDVKADDIIEQCTAVQNNYFAFEAAFTGEVPKQGRARLLTTLQWNVGEKRIRVNLLNTAWLSSSPCLNHPILGDAAA